MTISADVSTMDHITNGRLSRLMSSPELSCGTCV